MKIIKMIINEKKYIEDILNGKIENDLTYGKFVYLLSKYYKQKYDLNISKPLIVNETRRFYEDYFKFNEYKALKIIDSISVKTFKDESIIKETECLEITKEELEIISNYSLQEKKVLFSLLCLGKFSGSGWTNASQSTIFQLANIKPTKKVQDLIIRKFIVDGLLSVPNRVDSLSLKVNFIKDGTVSMKIYEMENLGALYTVTNEKGYMLCSVCGKLVKRKKNDYSSKYCKECGKEKILETKRESIKKVRNVDKA